MTMDERDAAEARSVKFTDKRRQVTSSGEKPEEAPPVVEAEVVEDGNAEEAARDYLDDLRRLQADFDNYRKRMMRDQAGIAERAKAELIGRLLPALDNFERALAHTDADPGIEMIFKELRSTLETEGLEEIPATGQPFDPNVHEAVMSNENEDVREPTVSQVYRSGYSFKGSIVRPAMVVVDRPGESANGGEA
jgi:molecular chaperone GrpE